MSDQREAAARAIACLDLTNLDEGCDAAAIDALCARARTPHGPVAAVCVWPAFVAQAHALLAGSGIRVVTVVNFPSGDDDVLSVRTATRHVMIDGADEIDMVVPWRALAAGERGTVAATVFEVRDAARNRILKTILETGELADPGLIRRAADEALEGGADFLKTSTGKVPVNATPEAALILLHAIRDSGRDAGLKAAGGVKTTEDAAGYLALCDREMGVGWATPAHFRIGASGVLTALLATLDGAEAPAAKGGY